MRRWGSFSPIVIRCKALLPPKGLGGKGAGDRGTGGKAQFGRALDERGTGNHRAQPGA